MTYMAKALLKYLGTMLLYLAALLLNSAFASHSVYVDGYDYDAYPNFVSQMGNAEYEHLYGYGAEFSPGVHSPKLSTISSEAEEGYFFALLTDFVVSKSDMTTLYRAVGPDELADLKNTEQLINRGSAEGKYFTTKPGQIYFHQTGTDLFL